MYCALTHYPANDKILRGLSTDKMQNCITYLEKQFKENIASPTGLSFDRLEVVDPISAAMNVTTRQNHSYDITRTDFALAYMHFTYKGEALEPLPLYVPVIGPVMYIAGSPYILRMVLSDKLLSPGTNDLFMRVYRGKAKISRADRGGFTLHYREKDKVIASREVGDVLLGNYFTPTIPSNMKITKCSPTLILYLLAKFGYEKMLDMVLGFSLKVVTIEDPLLVTTKDDVVFSTSNNSFTIAKSKHLIGKDYEVKITQAGFTLPRADYDKLSSTLKERLHNTVATLFYILDGMPSIEPQHIQLDGFWMIPFRDTLYGKDDDRKKELTASSHIAGLEGYMTDIVISDIHKEFGDTLGYDFRTDGFFKLMVVLLHKYNEWRTASALISASVTDKRLRLYYYMFVDIITQINIVNMLINNPKQTRSLDAAGVKKVIRTELNIGRMYRIKGGAGAKGAMKPNQAVKPLSSYSGDHKYIKITADTDIQINVIGAMGGAISKRIGSNEGDPTTLLDPGQCIAGTMNAITKSRLAATHYLNMFAPYDPNTETIRYDDEIREDIEELTTVLGRSSHRPTEIKIPREFNIHGDL